MEERKLDNLIQETLEEQAGRISMSPDLQRQIRQKVRSTKYEEVTTMRRISAKKVVIAAAVMCMAMSIVAVAGGKVAGWVSGRSTNNPSIKTYEDIKMADSKMGVKVQSVEKFTNGLAFDMGFLQDVQEVDENGVTVGTFPEVNIQYKKGAQRASFSAIPVGKDDGTAKHAETTTIPYGDEVLTVTKDYYKFVPPTYEITPEEQAAMDEGKLYISYGTEQVENEVMYAVSWEHDLRYLLLSSDSMGVSQEELVEMAKEVIDAQ